MKLLIALAGIVAIAALAQTGGPIAGGSGGPAAPVIPVELQLEYFRTDGVLAHLKAELAEANAEYEAAFKAIVKACGENSDPLLTQDKKRLFCVARAPAAAQKK
jgi:hypothetical protein